MVSVSGSTIHLPLQGTYCIPTKRTAKLVKEYKEKNLKKNKNKPKKNARNIWRHRKAVTFIYSQYLK